MKPDTSPIIPSILQLVLPCGGTGDVVGRQLHGAHYTSESCRTGVTAAMAPSGWRSTSVRGENKERTETASTLVISIQRIMRVLVWGGPDQEQDTRAALAQATAVSCAP